MWRHRSIADLRARRPLTLRAQRRGTAMVEAMLVIPVLIIVLAGAAYLRELSVARASARLAARACAWQSAMRGCEGDASAACATPLPSHDDTRLPDIAATARAQAGGQVDPFGEFPILGEAFAALFGRSTRATATASVPFPFDRERVGVASSEAVVQCNSMPTGVLDVASKWLEEVLP